ncbi:hypothetical protein HPP92_004386 [Vanilla planifolia]|uniref:Calmodulin-binding protein n=1 Tax=Vanilla planifolia TaxID=51239 RepID=A0A835RWL8_VANPL|nr:hypothetical protein HPP92_004386 [Vanilla planifolia]
MGTKRHQDGSDEDLSDQPEEKRIHVLPPLTKIIRKTIKNNDLQDLIVALEPLFRKLKEELERLLPSTLIQRPPQTQIQQIKAPSLQLIFKKPLSQPIFTGIKLEDEEGNPLQVRLVDAHSRGQSTSISLPSPLKLQVVVLNGDFPPWGRDDWTKEELEKSVVKEREGRRPLIIGEVNLTMKEGGCCTIGELVFTDNSSWIRSRHFRIGVTVVAGGPDGLRIREAMTERFVVKDHRGEAYKKHYPPSLDDEVWRLEKIAKEGRFHKRLESERIFTVGDFLKLHTADPTCLRKIVKMSDHMWEATVNHARTCTLGEKLYLYRGSQCNLLLSPICELLAIETDSGRFSLQDLNTAQKVLKA